MKILNLAEVVATFDKLFAAAKHDMFKAEVLQDYSAVDDSPSLRAWLSGDEEKAKRLGAEDKGIAAWRGQCLKSPAAITRIHIVAKPYTAYLQWETEVIYKASLLQSGAENVLIAPAAELTESTLPAGDFWIFDGKRVLQWEYENGNGKLAGGKVWDKANDDITDFLNLKKALLTVARPVS